MPYITNRGRYDVALAPLMKELEAASSGEVNYVISRILWRMWIQSQSYTVGNALIGVLACVAQEFYRRILVPYEDAKMAENGDVFNATRAELRQDV